MNNYVSFFLIPFSFLTIYFSLPVLGMEHNEEGLASLSRAHYDPYSEESDLTTNAQAGKIRLKVQWQGIIEENGNLIIPSFINLTVKVKTVKNGEVLKKQTFPKKGKKSQALPSNEIIIKQSPTDGQYWAISYLCPDTKLFEHGIELEDLMKKAPEELVQEACHLFLKFSYRYGVSKKYGEIGSIPIMRLNKEGPQFGNPLASVLITITPEGGKVHGNYNSSQTQSNNIPQIMRLNTNKDENQHSSL